MSCCFFSGSTQKAWPAEEMGEEVKDAGEEVEFLDTTVTVSHLPSVQFPEATQSKGTRLVDR